MFLLIIFVNIDLISLHWDRFISSNRLSKPLIKALLTLAWIDQPLSLTFALRIPWGGPSSPCASFSLQWASIQIRWSYCPLQASCGSPALQWVDRSQLSIIHSYRRCHRMISDTCRLRWSGLPPVASLLLSAAFTLRFSSSLICYPWRRSLLMQLVH